MTDEKKPNPHHNSVIQALLDLITESNIQGYEMTDIHELLEELQTNEEFRNAVTLRNNLHKYPIRSLSFIMSANFDACPERYDLSLEEQAILTLFEHIQDQTTGCVCISKSNIANILKLTQPQKRSIQNYLNNLSKCGFLEEIYKPPKGSHSPVVYRVNSKISWIGTRHNPTDIKTITMPDFTQNFKQTYTQAVVNGKKISCGTLSPILKKIEASADDTDLAIINEE